MGIAATFGVAAPVVLWIVFRHEWKSVLTGVGVFLIAVLVLESAVHKIVLAGDIGEAIKADTYLFALYGGLMAGIFEECGRYLAMRFVLKRRGSAVAYGIGHGGIECLLMLGFGMIANLTLAGMVNSGGTEALLAQLDTATGIQVENAIDQLENSSSWMFLYGIWERISALVLQVSLSIFVWYAVGKRWWLLIAAILLHASVDAVAILAKNSGSYATIEALVSAMAVAIAVMAFMIWKKERV